MGVNSSKKGILQELQKNKVGQINQISIDNQTNPRIEYNINEIENLEEEKPSSSKNEEDDDFDFDDIDFDYLYRIDSPRTDVKNIKKYPYNSIGTISVQFPDSDEIFVYTCFLIDSNVVVTLASNLDNKNKGGKAKSIATSFSEEYINWENIFIQKEEKSNEIKEKEKDKNPKDSSDNLSSKLAVIIYGNNINKEWLGVEKFEQKFLEDEVRYAVFSYKKVNYNDIIEIDEKENNNEIRLRETCLCSINPFLNASQSQDFEENELIKQSPGSPIFYKDDNLGAYVIGIINEFFQFQYFDKNTVYYLANMINKGRQYRMEANNGIDLSNIFQLNLEKHNLGTSDIEYLNTFKFKNLHILDLNSNSINSMGAKILSQSKYINSLEYLNLSNNKIGDEGLKHISKGSFKKLNSLHLSRNYITSEGIYYLVRAKFTNNLIALSLSDNRKIGDTGIIRVGEHKGWGKLKILNLDLTGLTDYGLSYLERASMPKLKELNIIDNNFTEKGKSSINALAKNHIKIKYKIGKEEKVQIIDYHEDDNKIIPSKNTYTEPPK